jgi:hypothetical protein
MGFAVTATWFPAQTGFAEAVMVSDTGNNGLTIIIITLEMAGEPDEQSSLVVTSQVTWSLFTGV